MRRDWQAFVIKVAAVLAATPRWVGALLQSEGFGLPETWLGWWIPLSAILSVAMAVVEGWSFSYIFHAWRRDSNNQLLIAAIISCLTFVLVLTPYVVSNVTGQNLNEVISGLWLWVWGASVGLATISIVISVGLAERRLGLAEVEQPTANFGILSVEGGYQVSCGCGWVSDKLYSTSGYASNALTNHNKGCPLGK